ncbi:MAG TPA: ABC-F type ribosomal protection protein [Clostridia bacterium]|nr:ABC-F type ribosomal protection protein [Clostridia bacterium]
MLLLDAGNIKKYYGDRIVTELDELKIYTGDRIGVIGQNGSGKTTLLDILAGRLKPDEGFVKRYCDVGYIRQFSEESMRQGEADEADEFSPKLLKEFELDSKLGREALSGGEQTRLKIAGALSSDNILLFADEPTSNLDYTGIDLFKQKLGRLESFVLISHDRSLLDELCNSILEVRDGKIRAFSGNYTSYSRQCENELEHANLEYEKYIEEKTSLEEAISNRKQRAKKVRKAPSRMGNSEARLHTRAANEKQEKLHDAANSLISRLEKLEVKEKPRELPGIKLDFSLTDPPENKYVISAEKLSFSYGPVKVFENAGFRVPNGFKTALWGKNGSGKTTLLNLIFAKYGCGAAASENSMIPHNIVTGKSIESISIVPRARIAYFCQGFENLVPGESVLWNVMRDSVQNETVARTILARLLLQGNDVHKKVAVLSGGEKIKASFAKLFVSSANVLLLDEPTNYLDMKSIEALEGVMKEYEGTVLFVSHDRSFVRAVADKLMILGEHSIRSFDGGLEEYEAQTGKSADLAAGKQPKGETGNTAGRIPDGIERTILQMRLTETIAKLSAGGGNRDALEEEYRRLVEQLR